MKKYLDLVGISEKKHKSSSRMIRLCIILSVFLVTVILGMVDACVKCQINQEIKENGNWHAVAMVNDNNAKIISMRNDVNSIGKMESIDEINLNGKKSNLVILDKSMFETILNSKITEGSFPKNDQEIILCETAKKDNNIKIGDTVKVEVNDKTYEMKISGFCDKLLKLQDKVPNVAIMGEQGFDTFSSDEVKIPLYVQFKSNTNMRQSIKNIKAQFNLGDKEIISNGNLLAYLMQSDENFVQMLYGCGLFLCLLVVVAAIIMITSSININVSQKTEFFGMMRCIGATGKQVKRYVRYEALRYCRTGVPIGVALAIVVVWGLCFILRTLSPMIFEGMPYFDVSIIAIVFGALIGILTVLISSMSPARKASKVSPLTAVSGNADSLKPIKKAAKTKFFKIDTILGIHHATGNKKNFVLMICSFALSIILFLSFNVTVDFMKKAVVPAQNYTPDIVLTPKDNNKITETQIDEIKKTPMVTKVSKRMDKVDIDSLVDGTPYKINLISFDDNQFNWANEKYVSGDINSVKNGEKALVVYDRKQPVKQGSNLSFKVNGKEDNIQVGAVISSMYDRYSNEATNIVVSESTFEKLTGSKDLSSVEIQQSLFANSSVIDKTKSIAGDKLSVYDYIDQNKSGRGAYFSFAFFVYGFLIVIALIAVTNIINSVAMGVNSRKKEYGFMRAVGMGNSQLLKTIIAQTLTYSVFGCIVGCIPGVLLNKLLFDKMVGIHWGVSWSFPIVAVLVIVLLVLITSVLAVRNPYKKIKNMSIIDNIACQ